MKTMGQEKKKKFGRRFLLEVFELCTCQKWGGWAESHLGTQSICNMGLDFLFWVVPYIET